MRSSTPRRTWAAVAPATLSAGPSRSASRIWHREGGPAWRAPCPMARTAGGVPVSEANRAAVSTSCEEFASEPGGELPDRALGGHGHDFPFGKYYASDERHAGLETAQDAAVQFRVGAAQDEGVHRQGLYVADDARERILAVNGGGTGRLLDDLHDLPAQ